MISFFRKKLTFDRPIFLVGCSKSGTTIAAYLFFMHPDINGGKNALKQFGDVNDPNQLTNNSVFGNFAHKMERKAFWDSFFPINQVDLRTGKELILTKNPLNKKRTKNFKKELKKFMLGKRLFSKAPFNTFRVHVLRELFPKAKIINIYRDGRDVISSWGKAAPQGGASRWEVFGGYENAINIFSKKWGESIAHIEANKRELDIFTFKYEDLVSDTQKTLTQLFNFCEMEYLPNIYDRINLTNQVGKWKERIPTKFHQLTIDLTKANLLRLGYDV